MRTLKSTKILSLILGMACMSVLLTPSIAQEYDDMYFNKSDRKKVKVEKIATTSAINKSKTTSDYKKISESTDTYSAKNINPEYIARYKSSEANEVNEQINGENTSYSSDDYFVEGYDKSTYVGDTNKDEIDYTALALRDQMSYSNHNSSFSSPSWRFSPYMSMGMGMGMGYGMGMMGYGSPYGYDPFMMGYGSGMNMGVGFGSGFGYSPSMAYSIGMSWGSGYNPWGGWGGYPGYYNPHRMYGYDPFRSMYGYNPYRGGFGNSYYGGGYYGGGYPGVVVVSSGGGDNMSGRRVEYKPRTSRSSTVTRTQNGSENSRIASTSSRVRVPSRATSTSNGRVVRDYSKIQNENYSRSARSSSSSKRLSSSSTGRSSYMRNSGYSSNNSTIRNNKPSRTTNFTSGNSSRSYSGRSAYSSGSKSVGRSSGSYSSPSRSSSSFSNSSGSRSSSFSSGSSGRSSSGSSSGSRSSGGSRGSRQ